MPNLNGYVLTNINRGSPQRVCGVTKMNKFIVLREEDTEIETLINVSNICWVKFIANNKLHIGFSDGTDNVFLNNGLELTEMLVGRPWYINIFNAVRWLFRKKHQDRAIQKYLKGE